MFPNLKMLSIFLGKPVRFQKKYKPHKLNSRFNFAWECHIEPDWLLVWEQDDNELTLLLIDTGTHSDIFG